jgi:serine/threonine protein kinase
MLISKNIKFGGMNPDHWQGVGFEMPAKLQKDNIMIIVDKLFEEGGSSKVYKCRYKLKGGKKIHDGVIKTQILYKNENNSEKQHKDIIDNEAVLFNENIINDNILKCIYHWGSDHTFVNKDGKSIEYTSYYFVFEYMDKGSLNNIILLSDKYNFNYKSIMYIINSIINGIESLHEKNYYHHDMKSHNILVNSNGDIKISDFGITLNLFPGKTKSLNAGTPGYTCPRNIFFDINHLNQYPNTLYEYNDKKVGELIYVKYNSKWYSGNVTKVNSSKTNGNHKNESSYDLNLENGKVLNNIPHTDIISKYKLNCDYWGIVMIFLELKLGRLLFDHIDFSKNKELFNFVYTDWKYLLNKKLPNKDMVGVIKLRELLFISDRFIMNLSDSYINIYQYLLEVSVNEKLYTKGIHKSILSWNTSNNKNSFLTNLENIYNSNSETDKIIILDRPVQRVNIGNINYERFNFKIGSGAFKEIYLSRYKYIDNKQIKINGKLIISKLLKFKKIAWNSIKMKLLKNDYLNSERIMNEVKILSSLNKKKIYSEYIIEYYGNIKIPGELIILTSYSKGNLLNIIKTHPFLNYRRNKKLNIIREWSKEILMGFYNMDLNDIIHRDIKPENILLNDFGNIRIIDFGLSTSFSNIKRKNKLNIPRQQSIDNTQKKKKKLSIVGTPEYTAPEIISEKYDNKVDIFSFGLTILELYMNKSPYHQTVINAKKEGKIKMGNIDFYITSLLGKRVKNYNTYLKYKKIITNKHYLKLLNNIWNGDENNRIKLDNYLKESNQISKLLPQDIINKELTPEKIDMICKQSNNTIIYTETYKDFHYHIINNGYIGIIIQLQERFSNDIITTIKDNDIIELLNNTNQKIVLINYLDYSESLNLIGETNKKNLIDCDYIPSTYVFLNDEVKDIPGILNKLNMLRLINNNLFIPFDKIDNKKFTLNNQDIKFAYDNDIQLTDVDHFYDLYEYEMKYNFAIDVNEIKSSYTKLKPDIDFVPSTYIEMLNTPTTDNQISDFITKCLEINPTKRFNFNKLLIHPFILNKKKQTKQTKKNKKKKTNRSF